MGHHEADIQPDFGTGQKKLGVYVIGFVICSLLTILSFWVVMAGKLEKIQILSIIFVSAIVQFVVQLICFLRLNLQTVQGRTNVMSLVFTGVILVTIVAGSLWIMWTSASYMGHY